MSMKRLKLLFITLNVVKSIFYFQECNEHMHLIQRQYNRFNFHHFSEKFRIWFVFGEPVSCFSSCSTELCLLTRTHIQAHLFNYSYQSYMMDWKAYLFADFYVYFVKKMYTIIFSINDLTYSCDDGDKWSKILSMQVCPSTFFPFHKTMFFYYKILIWFMLKFLKR